MNYKHTHLWNVGKLLPDYTALWPRRQPYSTFFWLNYGSITITSGAERILLSEIRLGSTTFIIFEPDVLTVYPVQSTIQPIWTWIGAVTVYCKRLYLTGMGERRNSLRIFGVNIFLKKEVCVAVKNGDLTVYSIWSLNLRRFFILFKLM
jgi:hypothetical protein